MENESMRSAATVMEDDVVSDENMVLIWVWSNTSAPQPTSKTNKNPNSSKPLNTEITTNSG